ncbi:MULTISPECIES: hypothetical protein [unclassified Gilliamella]|uniref:hypothetical protein n=1 Tax=unclassified Gilliamella TaxID=2685620 RepID=UPI00132A81BA|nr:MULTISPECIES: hypothetical protein [unclassified Gilliamella]MWN30836.1 hypothetical protein [Gilliamella sp. Pra-s60]MWP28599.1 hypothetical protein [Gilliamella sp. Pra-s54]
MASGIWHLACQTYALNLIDSHGVQNRAPQLFSSAKSFRVAKSTPSSAKLPPISKLLSKPPLQSKPSLLSKSALFFAPLLLLSYTQDVQALSAQTSRAIEGSAPYLTFDGGQTKATNTDTFLAIELPDGRRITQSTNTSSATNPIILPRGNYTFNDIHTVLPSGTTSISLNSLITQGKWGDDDGDGQGANGVTATGNISLTIKDKDGATVSRGDTLSKCGAPYKVTLSSTGGSLTTRYGVPNSSTFIGGSVEYYIKPDSSGSCYFVQSVRPNLLMGGTSGIDSDDNPIYAGPSNIWNPAKGFLTQSTNPSTYNLNFPTTGSNGLYFDLEIPTGIDGSQLSWTVNTSGRLGATVSWRRPLTGTFTDPNGRTVQADEWIRDKSKNVARVTLSGPEADSRDISSSNPGSFPRPALPQKFELVGRDSNGNEVRYGFVLRRWFVNRGNKLDYDSRQYAWCNSLGYQEASVRELTDARRSTNQISGAAPSLSGRTYTRRIGAGFFSEWGDIPRYATNYVTGIYFTGTPISAYKAYVTSHYGEIGGYSVAYRFYVICTTP